MKKLRLVGLLVLMIVSSLFSYTKASELPTHVDVSKIVYLEGAFLFQGEYTFFEEMTIKELIDLVGIEENANLDCLKLDKVVEDESLIYLPILYEGAISLNKASKKELMTLKGIGEKTAQKIIDYRTIKEFTCIEDIMKIKGIGEKTYKRLRNFLCL